MTLDSLLNYGSIIFTVAMAIYIIIATGYIISENRSPQSTFAWLFLFVTLPVIGIIIYIFFGHGWHAFSQEKEIARQELGNEFMSDIGPSAADAIHRAHCV